MSKEMIISVNGREKKIAILDNGKVTEFYIERGDEENSGIAGNIYKGRVQRVLPGMQSAFVSIGLERDAFLYVSDFFDEEEEIERIVMEKSKKGSQEDAKREANERIDRARIEREKQMDSAQELTEPLIEKDDEETEIESSQTAEDRAPKQDRERGRRSRRDRVEEAHDRYANAKKEEKAEREPLFPIEDSGFERIIDDSETGEMFKDAFMQEAIVDKVRAVEFDMESIDEAPVGSLLTDVTSNTGGFERIADEDDAPAEKPKRGAKGKAARSKKSDDPEAIEKPSAKPKKPSATKKKAASTRARSKKAAAAETGSDSQLGDQEASVKESSDNAEMSVRRGGRGRRRGGRGKKTEDGTDSIDSDSVESSDENENANFGFDDGEETTESNNVVAAETTESDESQPISTETGEDSKDEKVESQPKSDRGRREQRPNQSRERGGRGRENQAPREARNDRPEQSNRNDRPERNDRDRNDRGDRRDRPSQPTISDLLREGQEILVQIAKEPIAKKGARITSHIALPGRFLVYMPTIEHLGVSRKIESASERSRLRTLIQRIRQDEEIPSGGFIVRTAGIGISEEDLRQDARYLAGH